MSENHEAGAGLGCFGLIIGFGVFFELGEWLFGAESSIPTVLGVVGAIGFWILIGYLMAVFSDDRIRRRPIRMGSVPSPRPPDLMSDAISSSNGFGAISFATARLGLYVAKADGEVQKEELGTIAEFFRHHGAPMSSSN